MNSLLAAIYERSWDTMSTASSSLSSTTFSIFLFVVISFLLYVTAATGFRVDSLLKKWRNPSWSDNTKNTAHNSMDQRRTLSKSELSVSLSSIIPWWDDLAPPFALAADHSLNDDEGDFVDPNESFYYEEGLEVEGDASTDTRRSSSSSSQSTLPAVTHFCFLVHGHRGMARDLAYLEEVMRLSAKRQKLKLRRRHQKSLSSSLSTSALRRNSPSLTTAARTASSDDDDDDDDQSDVSLSSSTSTSTPPSEPVVADAVLQHHDLIIHSASCNEGKTTDGVANGGDRLVEEMLTVIRNVMEQQQRRRRQLSSQQNQTSSSNHNNESNDDTLQDITVSVVGNSLGGIYVRYAVAQLVRKCKVVCGGGGDNPSLYILDGRYRLHLNIFCTTASPHLGVSGHTYLPLPRTAELGVAHAMGVTGKDLFRVNDLMKRMATTSHFLTPLSQFRKRIAYANAYGTDFPVPAATAAFLSPASTYPHYFSSQRIHGSNIDHNLAQVWEGSDDDEADEDEEEENGLIIATLHTPAQSLPALQHGMGGDETSTSEHGVQQDSSRSNFGATETETQSDDLLLMSNSLDSLGWKKVFVDIRREIPIAVSLPTKLLKRSKSEVGAATNNNNEAGANTTTNNTATTSPYHPLSSQRSPSSELRPTTLQELRQRRRVESRDVAMAVCSAGDNTWNLPIGHNMIVAFSRSRISTLINKGGRPVVDSLAKELVEDIFSWKSNSATTTAQNSTTCGGTRKGSVSVEPPSPAQGL